MKVRRLTLDNRVHESLLLPLKVRCRDEPSYRITSNMGVRRNQIEIKQYNNDVIVNSRHSR